MNTPNLEELDLALINNDYYVLDNFLSQLEINNLQQLFVTLDERKLFATAQVGKGLNKKLVTQIRSDRVYWIEDWDLSTETRDYRHFLSALQNHFKRSLFLPLKRFESHMAIYDKGAFYKKHYDQHRNSPHRQISIVLYISDYKNGNGGELVVHRNNEVIKIEPRPGRLVIFKSRDILHEVLETTDKRCSITSWLRDDLEIL